VVGARTSAVALAIVLAFALLMMWDNRRTGIQWESTGPQAGYFPFYVSLITRGACLFGLCERAAQVAPAGRAFVRRNQFKRVLQVCRAHPPLRPRHEWLGLYVRPFALVSGFMHFIGRIKPWNRAAPATSSQR